MRRFALLSENGEVIGCDQWTWAQSFDKGYRTIRQEDLAGGYWLSTIFLGLNHQYGEGEPLWFETMIFSPPTSKINPLTGREMREVIFTDRYTTMEKALEGHQRALKWFYEESDHGISLQRSEADDPERTVAPRIQQRTDQGLS